MDIKIEGLWGRVVRKLGSVSTAGGAARAIGDLEKEEPYIRYLCPRSAVHRIRYFVQRIKFKLVIKLVLHSIREIS